MLGWIREKMVNPESGPRGGKFSAFGSTTVGNSTSTYSDPCTPCGDYSIATKNGSWDNAHTSDLSSRGKRLGGEPSTLVQHAQRMGGNFGAWGPTPFRFSPCNVECKKGEG
jgi:hypothetical protein